MTSPSSTHNFKLHHFSSPTWCDLCTKFIWGLGLQGYWCQNCRYSVHKKCYHEVESSCNPQKKPPEKLKSKDITSLVEQTDGRVSREEVQRLQKHWNAICGTNGATFENFVFFYKAMAEKASDFSSLPVSVTDEEGMKRLFTSIDKNNDGEISFNEYVLFAAVLKNPKAEEVLRISFALMDENGDGVREEMLKGLSGAKSLSDATEDVELSSIIDQIFEVADKDKSGTLTLDEVLTSVSRYPYLMSKFCI